MNRKKIKDIPALIAFTAVMALTAYLCLTIQGNYAANGNISWLLIGAERLLQGQIMSEHIYEPNPPLSLIVYIPHVLFSHLARLPLPIGAFYVTFMLALLSTLAAHRITARFTFLSKTEHLAFTACYFIALTLTTVVFYSEREHFIILGLAPFVLIQFALSERIKLPRYVTAPVLALGAIGVMIKPHYGLAPTVFLVMRMIKHRTINLLKAPDFIALSSVTILYVLLVVALFNDYVRIIFHELLTLYVGKAGNYAVILQASHLQTILFVTTFIIEMLLGDGQSPKDRFIRFLYLCSILTLIPYYVQMKGFYNHLIPANSFFMMAVGASIALRTAPFLAGRLKKYKAFAAPLGILIPFFCVLGVSTALIPLNNDFPTHADMRRLPVAQLLEEKCEQPCAFFSFHSDMEIMPSTAAVMGYEHASRFGSLWSLIGVMMHLQSEDPVTRNEALQIKERYSRYMLEDLRYYDPSVLIIAKDIQTPVREKPLNFMEFFGAYKPLRTYIETHYTKDKKLEFDRSVYFKGTTMDYPYTMTYDIYVRKGKKGEENKKQK